MEQLRRERHMAELGQENDDDEKRSKPAAAATRPAAAAKTVKAATATKAAKAAKTAPPAAQQQAKKKKPKPPSDLCMIWKKTGGCTWPDCKFSHDEEWRGAYAGDDSKVTRNLELVGKK